ncbi:MAG: hypothetical protein KY455_10280 [Euryarchaeota archaeon]|nr:hypothetical protein [Euryarchaeota archaeon]
MRLVAVSIVLALLFSGCTTLSTSPAGDDLCSHVPSPSPRPTAAGGTPLPTDTEEPTPGRTPAYAPPPIAESGWEVYHSLEGSRFHETGLHQAVIRDQEEWTCFWRIHSHGGVLFHPVDFDEDTILVITLGPQPSAGHAIHSVGIQGTEHGFEVRYERVRPAPECALEGERADAPIPTLLIRHRPADPLPYSFKETGVRTWYCVPMQENVTEGAPVRFDEVASQRPFGGDLRDFSDPAVMVLEAPEPWHPYLGDLFSDGGDIEDRFDEAFLLVATSGARPSFEYDLEIRSLERNDHGHQLRLEETRPGAGCPVTPAISSPSVFAWVPRDDAPPKVEATLDVEQVDCGEP